MGSTVERFTKLFWAIAAVVISCALGYGVFVLGEVRVKAPLGVEITLGRPDFDRGVLIPQLQEGYQVDFGRLQRERRRQQTLLNGSRVDSDSKLDTFAERLMNAHVSVATAASR